MNPFYEKRKGGEKEKKTQHINFLILNYVLSDFFGGVGEQKFHHLETIGSQKPLTDWFLGEKIHQIHHISKHKPVNFPYLDIVF